MQDPKTREIDSNARSTQSLSLDRSATQPRKEISSMAPKLDLTLKLGHDLIPPTKRRRYGNQPSCQVDGCVADLSAGKDYHRRHKVCELHSKATDAVVARQPQRFCQQCSKFHPLPEFDEGKRSCRWRLEGHNKRRRKPRPEGEKSEDTDSGSQVADGSSSVALPTGGGDDWEIANLLVAMSRGSAPAMRSMKCPSTIDSGLACSSLSEQSNSQ